MAFAMLCCCHKETMKENCSKTMCFCISTEIASRTRKSPISKKTVNVISWCSTTIW